MKEPGRQNARVRDMTAGDPIRLILAFAVPLFLGNIFQQVYTMIDTMVVGYFIGDDAISAIGASSSLYNLLMNLAISMNSGYAIITTQAFGARDGQRLRHAVAGTLVLNGAATVLLTVLAVVFLRPLLRFMNTPESIFEQAYLYIFILCAGLFSTIGYNMFAGILRAVGNSRTPLYFLIVSSVLNVVLDLVFVAVIPLGVAGAALATVIAQTVSAVLCGATVLRGYQAMLPQRGDFAQSRRMWGSLLSSGLAMALMLSVVNLGTLIFQRANNVLGETIIAAHAAAHRIINIVMQPLGTIASANSTFVSQNWGAGKYDRIRAALRRVMGLEILWGVIACALIYAVGGFLIQLITGTENAEIIGNGVMAMRISLPFFPILGVLLCLRTAMQAMGYKAAPVVSSCLELLLKWLSAALLIPAYGYLGTCVTEPLSWVVMTAFLVTAYLIQRRKIFSLPETPAA